MRPGKAIQNYREFLGGQGIPPKEKPTRENGKGFFSFSGYGQA